MPVQIGQKMRLRTKKGYDFWDARVQHTTALDLK